MAKLLELNNGSTQLRLAPALGGGVVDLQVLDSEGEVRSIFRPWAGEDAGLFGLGLNVLAPFSNRIAGGGFAFPAGTFHPIDPNLDGEQFPIHGDAFQKSWDVVCYHADHAQFVLGGGAIGPFRYQALVNYRLLSSALIVKLKLLNLGETLPYGGGFHPWFPRFKDTQLQFEANGVWMEDERHLPTWIEEVDEGSIWSFSQSRQLPFNWINNCFVGWPGRATILHPGWGMQVSLTCSSPMHSAIVFSPAKDCGFFCFEPVSHPVNAHNLERLDGLSILPRGGELALDLTIEWTFADVT